MSILQVEGLTKTYGKGDAEVEALHDVTFSVDKGEFVANYRRIRIRQIHADAPDRRRGKPHSRPRTSG